MPLPPEWVAKDSKSYKGRKFYYNKLTRKTQWESPPMVEDEDYPEINLNECQERTAAGEIVTRRQYRKQRKKYEMKIKKALIKKVDNDKSALNPEAPINPEAMKFQPRSGLPTQYPHKNSMLPKAVAVTLTPEKAGQPSVDPYLEELNTCLSNSTSLDLKNRYAARLSKRRKTDLSTSTPPTTASYSSGPRQPTIISDGTSVAKYSPSKTVNETSTVSAKCPRSSTRHLITSTYKAPIKAIPLKRSPNLHKTDEDFKGGKSLKCKTKKTVRELPYSVVKPDLKHKSSSREKSPTSRPVIPIIISTHFGTGSSSPTKTPHTARSATSIFGTGSSSPTKTPRTARSATSIFGTGSSSPTKTPRTARSASATSIFGTDSCSSTTTPHTARSATSIFGSGSSSSTTTPRIARSASSIFGTGSSSPTTTPRTARSATSIFGTGSSSPTKTPRILPPASSEPEYMEVDVEPEQAISSVMCIRKRGVKEFGKCFDEIVSDSSSNKHHKTDIDVVVVDTNVLISHFKLLKSLIIKSPGLYFVIPWIVIQELDGLKECKKSDVASSARQSIKYLLEEKKRGNLCLKFEPSHISSHTEETPDDRVVACLHWAKRIFNGRKTMLLSNDNNLCLKALIHSYESFTVTDFQAEMNRSLRHTSTGSTDEDDYMKRSRTPLITPDTQKEPQFLSKVMPRTISLAPMRPPRELQLQRRASVDSYPISPVTPTPSPITPTSQRRVDKRLAHFSGGTIPPPSVIDVDRKDKPIIQVLDEMSASMLVFRQQVLTFSEAQISSNDSGHVSELTEIQTFLSQLIPDVLRIIEACQAVAGVPMSRMKQNFSVVMDMASAIQIYTVHHLKYAPNISPIDMFQWIQLKDNMEVLATAKRHFCDLLNEVQNAVDDMLSIKVYTA